MTKIAFFQTHKYERKSFDNLCASYGYDVDFLEPRLTRQTAPLASHCDVVCSFVNDKVNAETIANQKECGVRLIALRCAGFNHVDVEAAMRAKGVEAGVVGTAFKKATGKSRHFIKALVPGLKIFQFVHHIFRLYCPPTS